MIDQNILTVDLDSALSDVDPTRFKDSYFNTGVRVLQNEKERTGALLSKLYEAAKAPMTAADQSAYNRAFVHGTKALPHTAHHAWHKVYEQLARKGVLPANPKRPLSSRLAANLGGLIPASLAKHHRVAINFANLNRLSRRVGSWR